MKQMSPAIADAVARFAIDLGPLKGEKGEDEKSRAADGGRTGDHLGHALAR